MLSYPQEVLSEIVKAPVPTLRQYVQYVLALRGVTEKDCRFREIFSISVPSTRIDSLLDNTLVIEDRGKATIDFSIRQFRFAQFELKQLLCVW